MHTFWFWHTYTNTFKYSCLLRFSQQHMTNTVMIRVPFYMCPNGSNLHNTTGISLTPDACYDGTFQQCLFKKYLFANFIIETLTASLKKTFVPIWLLLFDILNASLKNTFVSIWSLTLKKKEDLCTSFIIAKWILDCILKKYLSAIFFIVVWHIDCK